MTDRGITWWHLSDLHRGAEGQERYWPAVQDALARDFERCAEKIGAQYGMATTIYGLDELKAHGFGGIQGTHAYSAARPSPERPHPLHRVSTDLISNASGLERPSGFPSIDTVDRGRYAPRYCRARAFCQTGRRRGSNRS